MKGKAELLRRRRVADEWSESVSDFVEVCGEAIFGSALPQRGQRCLLPAMSFAVGVTGGQFAEDAFGASLRLVVFACPE